MNSFVFHVLSGESDVSNIEKFDRCGEESMLISVTLSPTALMICYLGCGIMVWLLMALCDLLLTLQRVSAEEFVEALLKQRPKKSAKNFFIFAPLLPAFLLLWPIIVIKWMIEVWYGDPMLMGVFEETDSYEKEEALPRKEE